MKSVKIYFGLLLSLFILASCEKEIAFNGVVTEPMIVVNSFITPDSLISVHVSESRFFLTSGYTFTNLDNATVSLWVNGVLKEDKLKLIESGIYKSTYQPQVGETIKLIVKATGKQDVSCEEKIGVQPIITAEVTDSVKYTPNDTNSTIISRKINYKLNFKDNINEKNYYRLVIIKKEKYILIDTITNTTKTDIRDNYEFDFTDVISGNSASNNPLDFGSSVSNTYNIFSDDLINGKDYSLTFSTTDETQQYKTANKNIGVMPSGIEEVHVYLQNISKGYFLYLKSRQAASSGDSFFSEPVQVYNNITDGIGILGSYTSSNVVKIKL
jgi:hypothetical protein